MIHRCYDQNWRHDASINEIPQSSLRFCCASKMPTASEAREPDLYRDRSNRLLESLPVPVIPRYTISMKTAISLPDEIFESADALAERLGLSRSELYATAVAEYLAKHRGEDVTARLNDVFADHASGVDPAVRSAQARSIGRSEW